MAKSAKHKKLRRQEKAKTQLTGVKKLGKAQNVVEPTLKAKKILVREQLKTFDDDDLYTKRKQNLQDVLSSLNHHNTNIKKDGINGLTELITSQSSILNLHLDRILEKVAQLTSEVDSSVRKENLKIAEVIFARVNENQVQPFWNLLLTHMKCTLTSLNPVVRSSCLSFIQLLISYFPNLIAGSLHKILPILMGLISSSTSVKDTSKKMKNKVRLKVEISGKTSDIAERLRVLSLIATCLSLNKKNNSADDFQDSKEKGSMAKESIKQNGVRKNTVRYDAQIKGSNFLSLNYPWGYHSSDTQLSSSLDFNSIGLALNDDSSSACNGSVFSSISGVSTESPMKSFWKQFIHSCLPILCETWVEVGPSSASTSKKSNQKKNEVGADCDLQKIKGNDNDDNTRASTSTNHSNLNKPAVDVLACIISVMDHLIHGDLYNDTISSIGQKDKHDTSDSCEEDLRRDIRKIYGRDLTRYFLQWMPFSAVQDTQRRIIVKLNLEIFHIAADLRLFNESLMQKFDNFLKGLIKRESLDSESTCLVLKILICLHMPDTGNLMTKFLGYALKTPHKSVIHNFLNHVLRQNNSNSNEVMMLTRISWSTLCPQIMKSTDKLTPKVLSFMTLISIRKLAELKTVVEPSFSKFLEYAICENSCEAWEQIIRLFYYCDAVDLFVTFVTEENANFPPEILTTLESLKK